MSQSIATSIAALESARVAILNSINAKGGDLPSYAGFYSFAGAISNLPSGGGYTEYTGSTTLTAVMQTLEQARQAIISSINAQGGSLATDAGFSNEYSRGKSLPEIIRGLEKDGIESPWGRSWAPTVLANMLRNEKYCGDVLIQKFYTQDHMSHKIIRNDQSLVPSYFIRDHHEPIVDRKTYDLVQIIRSLKDKHKGAVQYPYYGRLICPNCGEPMIRHCTREHGRPSIWRCISENEKCRKYFIREKYIDAAFIKAYREIDIKTLQPRKSGDAGSPAAQYAIKIKTEMPEIDKVEYYILDALVEEITFRRWDVMEIQWTFGTKSKVQIDYECAKDIPNNKEQIDCVGIMSLSHTAEHSEVVPRYNSYKRPHFYGYDSIVPEIAEGGKKKCESAV